MYKRVISETGAAFSSPHSTPSPAVSPPRLRSGLRLKTGQAPPQNRGETPPQNAKGARPGDPGVGTRDGFEFVPGADFALASHGEVGARAPAGEEGLHVNRLKPVVQLKLTVEFEGCRGWVTTTSAEPTENPPSRQQHFSRTG